MSDITWISGASQRLYNQVLDLVRSSAGTLNFHDSLIVLICREQGISVLVSFDQDFDQINWLTRVSRAAEVARVFSQGKEQES